VVEDSPYDPHERRDPRGRVTRLAGYLGSAGFTWLTLFQLLLAAWACPRRDGLGRDASGPAGAAQAGEPVQRGPCRRWRADGGQASGLGPDVLPDMVVRPLLGALRGPVRAELRRQCREQSRIERLHGVPLTIILPVLRPTGLLRRR
jgi:hypothetical protein